MSTCSVVGCPRASRSRGMCDMHYKRWLRRGTTVLVNPGWPGNLLCKLRFMPRGALASGCIEFTGSLDRGGYGRLSKGGRTTGAHRAAYELVRGPIPEGLHLDHLCRNPPCVNPAHLEPVTARENVLRGETIPARNIAKTHCVNGHEYTPENTYWRRDGCRDCRACQAVRRAARVSTT